MAKPPCRKFLLNKNLKDVVLKFSLVCLYLVLPLGLQDLYAKDNPQIARLTNNNTFYATEIPFLNPAPALLAMRHVPTHEPISMVFDLAKATELAKIAKQAAPYKSSHGRCQRFVRMALEKLMAIKSGRLDLNSLPNDPVKVSLNSQTASAKNKHKKLNFPNKGLSAENFKNWALHNPHSLCRNLKLANVNDYPELTSQEGAVLLYGKNRCGFHRRYGHAEILTNAKKGEACSDHCRIINQPCEPDAILVSVKHCGFLKDERKDQQPMLSSVQPKPLIISQYIERPSPSK